MSTSGKNFKCRDRLDKSLASPDLTNPDKLKTLIRNQLLSTSLNGDEECSEEFLHRRTKKVAHFLEMLRSASIPVKGTSKASEKSYGEWKLKQDNEEYRVMYREGPPGTPFHTLLVEGYIDGPIDACLCVAWESALYKKWCPQHNIPTFKIVSSKCLRKIRFGEQISLVRVKVSWPLLPREAIARFFMFEYFQDDLVIVVLNTIDESEIVDGSEEAKGSVRVAAVGGFALQKVSSTTSYFRAIANMDLKLGFVPPSLVNFISRQLVGSGLKRYQKTIGSVFNSDEEFKKALSDPMYRRIRETLYSSSNEQKNSVIQNKGIKIDANNALQVTEEDHVSKEEQVSTDSNSKIYGSSSSTDDDFENLERSGITTLILGVPDKGIIIIRSSEETQKGSTDPGLR